MNDTVLKKLGLAVLETECAAVDALKSRIDDDFVRACHFMLECEGRVVVIGMGKSGHVGSKIAATLASTGTPAFFVHPGEASHGDLGMITSKDVVLALSNSGETDEILTILPIIKRLKVPLISMTGNPESTLAKAAAVNLDVGVEKEACPLDLAPTSSTTTATPSTPANAGSTTSSSTAAWSLARGRTTFAGDREPISSENRPNASAFVEPKARRSIDWPVTASSN